MKRLVAIFILIAVVALFGFVVISGNTDQDSQNLSANEAQEEVVEEVQQELKTVESRLLFVGDIFWGRHIELLATQSNDPMNHPFRGLDTLSRDQYDTWVANVECPITNNVVPYQTQIDTLIFNCRPEYIEGFKKYFDVVSLANNHTDNQGLDGLIESRRHLENANLQHFGHYDSSVTEDLCDVVVIKAKITGDSPENVELPVAMCGFHGVFNTPTEDQISVIDKYAEIMPTFAMPHSGTEYKPGPDSIKEASYKSIADHGADVVIGGHPHWVQNTEVYNDTLIVYSLGNFIFDQNFDTEVSRGVALDITMSLKKDEGLDKWIELASSCKTWKDTCLEDAIDQGLTKPEFDLTFDMIGVQNQGYLTSKASESIEKSLLERTNWADTLKQLGQ